MNDWTYEKGAVFIVMHDYKTGEELMINPRAIESIEGSWIKFDSYAYCVNESYKEIKSAIIKALGMVTGKVTE